MADRQFFDEVTYNPRPVRLKGIFSVSGTGDPSSTTGQARAVTLTREAAGKYRVKWTDSFLRLVGFSCAMCHDSSGTAQVAREVRGGKLAEASNYVEILMRRGSTGVLTNPATATTICYTLEFEDGNF